MMDVLDEVIEDLEKEFDNDLINWEEGWWHPSGHPRPMFEEIDDFGYIDRMTAKGWAYSMGDAAFTYMAEDTEDYLAPTPLGLRLVKPEELIEEQDEE